MPMVVVTSKDGDRSYLLEEGRPMFIGRAKECDILLPSPAVSRRHAVLLYKNGICGIKDLASFNGTILNDYPIGEPRHITENDTVRISSFLLRLHPGVPDAPDSEDLTPSPQTLPGSDATVDLSMHAVVQPARPQSLRPDATRYSSTIRLPRAMHPDDAADDGYDDGAMDETLPYAPGGESAAVIGGGAGRPGAIDFLAPAEKTWGMPPFAAAAAGDADDDMPPRETDAALPGPDDTGFFREELLPGDDAQQANETDKGGEVVEIEAEPALTNPEAEAIIPLFEPDVQPTLTLEEDRATSEALERLVEDLPTYDREIPVAARHTDVDAAADAEPLAVMPEEPDPIMDTGEFQAAGTRVGFASETGRYDRAVAGPRPDTGSLTPSLESIQNDPAVAGLENIAISPELMTAINTRLSLYALLLDLAEERNLLRLSENLPGDVREELNRQDAELDNLPTAAEASRLAAELRARRDTETEEGLDRQTEAMRTAEEMAVSQWMLIRDSNLEALPAVYKETYRLAADEPLAIELTRAKIAHGRLLGGAVYLLALELLSISASRDRNRASTRIRRLSEETGGTGVLSKLGKFASTFRNRNEIRDQAAQLEKERRSHAYRAELAQREMRFITTTLNREFRSVYTAAALHFIPRSDDMPVAVRAFLRYGAIGFKPWWLSGEAKHFIIEDCRQNVVTGRDQSRDELNILYADEYLAAVAAMECSPSPDESLANMGTNSTELKTDRAYRRIVNAGTYNELMQKMMADLDVRMQLFDSESRALEERMAHSAAELLPGKREDMFELQAEHQTIAIRKSNLENQIKRIEKEVVSSIIDSVQEAEGRFRKGELTMPTPEFLIEREVNAIFDQCRRMGDKRERFMPMVLRMEFPPRRDIVNIRGVIRMKMAKFESLDPGLFVNIIIPAKKRANRVDLRISPIMAILPVAGQRGVCVAGRDGMEGGHLTLPLCFLKEDAQDRQLRRLLADFRWETSRRMVKQRDLINSDTLAGAFMRVRWEWRNHAKARREKGLIFNEQIDQVNWRRVYEVYLPDAMSGGKQLFLRNPDCYNAIIGKYIELPQGVPLLRRSLLSP